ncbi:hypothetical protein DICPUDRAFT_49821 [Dictyostelium purpureum]|uniref:TPR-like protein n=1 Tax=Dictyostelium purpureum TaxID=5786 RepID=F0ZVK2_DICPU|nr:uncharacterized protein DICPUDRAFT_49821 [Dictyostelium purpureum]EGC32024.1 hypothetical protein DICPUDRAFT_49821 [Dictyostelium purpureum]|eukprot:XP_003291442.1 hypothetical protein DICPUDRAFT_49821 [Dictyostelium purpureum]
MDYIKDKLKEARVAIDKKDYKTVLEICTEIIQYDDKNPMIHLFMGLANYNLNNYTQAEKSYIAAVKLQPNSPTPLKGLYELYSKTNENEKITNIIKQLLPLTTDLAKKKEYSLKLIDLSTAQKDYKTALDLILPMIEEVEKENSSGSSDEEKIKFLEKCENINFLYYQSVLKSRVDEKLREKNIPIIDPNQSAMSIGGPKLTPDQVIERDKIEFEINKQLINGDHFDLSKYNFLINNDDNIKYLNNDTLLRIYNHYIQILILKRRYQTSENEQKIYREKINKECQRMNSILGNPSYSLEQLINLLEEDIGNSSDPLDEVYEEINRLSTILTSKYPVRGLGWIGLGFYAMSKKSDYSDSSKQLIEKGFSNTGSTDSLLGYLALSKWYLEQMRASPSTSNHDRIRDIIKKSSIVFEKKQKAVGPFFDGIYIELQLILVESFCFNSNFDFAVNTLEKLLEREDFPTYQHQKIIFELAKLYFETKDYEKSKLQFKTLLDQSKEYYLVKSKTYLPWIDVLSKANDKEYLLSTSKPMILECIKIKETYLNLYVLGLICLATTQDKTEATQSLLKSAKLNPNFSDTFAKLGTIYKDTDKERSKKCYQKSLSLDILNAEAGFNLGQFYADAGQTSLVMSLYKEITEYCTSHVKRFPINIAKCSWAYYRLAIYQMDNKDTHGSVVSLLAAIKGEPNNESYWRALAEAYRRQFKYVASLKSLRKAEEILDSEHRVASDINFQIATLSKTLALYSDAVQEYDRVLAQIENNVPSLKGKAECLLELSKDNFKYRNFTEALKLLKIAEESVKAALEKEPEFHSLWRLYGDICGFYLNLPVNDQVSKVEKSKQSSEAYFKCVKIHSNASSLQDLSIGYYNQYIIYKNQLKLKLQQEKSNSTSSPTTKAITLEETDNLLKSSIKCIIESINLSPNDFRLWNLLGVTLMDNFPEQSQHAFIRSIQLDSSKSEPYNNLTLLYLQYGFFELSEKSLMIAKNNNIDSATSWSIQGLLNEIKSSIINHNTESGNNEKEQPIDDYNFIDNELDSSPIGEGLLGYGITSMLGGYSETSFSVLYKYVEMNPKSVEANNCLGLVYSNQKDYTSSEKYFQDALQLLLNNQDSNSIGTGIPVGVDEEKDMEINNSNQISIGSILFKDKSVNFGKNNNIIFKKEEKIKYISINLARSQYNQNKYAQALETLKPYINDNDCKTKNSLSNSLLWELFSLIYCKLDKTDLSIDSIKKAITLLPKQSQTSQQTFNNLRKQNLLLILAKVQFSSKDNSKQFDTIIKTLEAIITIDSKFYKAWYFMASVYVSFKKYDMAIKTLKRLQDTVKDLEIESYLLLSQIHVLNNNDIENAKRELEKAVHLFPNDEQGWTALAELELQFHQKEDPLNLPLKLLGHSLNKKTSNYEYSGMGQLSIGPNHKVELGPSVHDLEILAKAHLFEQQSPYNKSLDSAISIMKRIIHSNPSLSEPWLNLLNLIYWRSIYTVASSNDNNNTDEINENWENVKACWNTVQYKCKSEINGDSQLKFQQDIIELEFLIVLNPQLFKEKLESQLKEFKADPLKQSVLLSLQAKFHLRNNEKDQALTILKNSLKIEPNSIETYHQISDIYESNDSLELSLLCLNRSLLILKNNLLNSSNNNNNNNNNNNIGLYSTTLCKIIRILIIQKKFKEANKLLDQQMANEQPNISDNTIIKLLKAILIVSGSKLTNSNMKQYNNDMKNAFTLLEETIVSNSKLSLTNFYLAVVEFNLKNFVNSEKLLQKELNISPSTLIQINSLQDKIKQFTK